MLEELFNLVNGVVNQQALPSDQKNAVAAEATNTVASGLRNMVAGGGLESVLSLFGNSDQQRSGSSLMGNPIVSMMIGHFTEKLMSKFKLNSNEASNVAGSLIPEVIGNLVNKSVDPANNQFSLENLLNSITGGKVAEVIPQQSNGGGGLQDILSQLSGGGSAPSGGGGLMDIISKLAGGARQQQQRNGGGGLMDLIAGFIK